MVLSRRALQILDEAPDVYAAADRLIEAADWIVWRLTGRETRNGCTAGYKAIWSKADGFPDARSSPRLDPRFATVVDEKMSRDVRPLGERAGGLTAEAAALDRARAWNAGRGRQRRRPRLVPAVGVIRARDDGRGHGHEHLPHGAGRRARPREGMCGVVEDGIVPGLFGYEAGQSAVGDIFAWFTGTPSRRRSTRRRAATGRASTHVLEARGGRLRPGESGLLALDWWNGNRSILVDTDLSGLLVGATLATRPADIYRALLEATAFGTRAIIESLDAAGVAVERIVACGGLPERNALLMQLTADITGREVDVAASSQAPAVGAAMYARWRPGAAGGGYDSIEAAAAAMARPHARTYRPDPARPQTYDTAATPSTSLLHDYFGRGANDVMKRLRAIRRKRCPRLMGPSSSRCCDARLARSGRRGRLADDERWARRP